jgi:hypothetical protein
MHLPDDGHDTELDEGGSFGTGWYGWGAVRFSEVTGDGPESPQAVGTTNAKVGPAMARTERNDLHLFLTDRIPLTTTMPKAPFGKFNLGQ